MAIPPQRPGDAALPGDMLRAMGDDAPRPPVPQAGGEGARAHRVGTLFKLADLLVRENVLEDPVEGTESQHRLQKCAYIAQQMGS